MPFSLLLLKALVRSGVAHYLPGVGRLGDDTADLLGHFSDAVLGAPREAIAEAAGLLEPPPADVIDLGTSVPRVDFGMPPPRLPAERRLSPPAGLPELRGTVAEKLLAEQALAVSPTDEVLVTHGASGALHLVLDAFVNRGDRVALFDPSSPLFTLALRARGAKSRWVGSWVEEGRLRFKLGELEKGLRGAKLLLLASPGNPAGGYVSAEDLDQIAYWADRHDVLLASDETYGRFRHEGEWVRLGTLSRARKRTLTLGSVSHDHGLAALRVGWLAGARALVRPCLLAAALRASFVSSLDQQAAAAALRSESAAGDLGSRRRYAFERLHGMGLKPAWPSGGLFLWVPVWEHGLSGAEFARRLLNEQRVRVTPGDLFGPSGPGYVRVSFAGDEGRLREGLGRTAEFMLSLRGLPSPARVAA